MLDDLYPEDAGLSPARAPSVRIAAPADGSDVSTESIRIEGSASDDRGVAAVTVRVGPNQPLLAQTDDNYATWWVESVAPVGDFAIEAVAQDVDAQVSTPARISLTRNVSTPDDAAPTIAIEIPEDGSSPLHPLVLVRGTASDDRAVVAIDVTRDGERLTERMVETTDLYAHWSRLVPLNAGVENLLVFTARDAAGNEATASLTLQGRATTDREPPALDVTSPQDAAQLSAATLDVAGSATDNVGVREVKLRVGALPTGASEPLFGDYQPAQTSDGYASFTANLAIPTGAFQLEVRAIDLNGLSASVTRNLVNAYLPEWGGEVALPLRLQDDTTPVPLHFGLTREGVQEVFTEAIQKDIRVMELDTAGLITSAVDQIKTSCGVRWRENNENPRHDCAAAGYGQDRSPPIPWQQTPEYAMVRLLTMTPANAVVAGTSMENLQGLADLLGIGGGFHQILADTLGISLTSEIVTTPNVVQALQTFWMQAHPQVLPGAKLPITLYDALHDLAPLAERFGPAGTHPGLLDPAFTPHSEILADNFKMNLVATSNLRWLDGVDASGTDDQAVKEYFAVVVDTAGPTFDDVLEFDFTDPAKFGVEGLVDQPTVDMRMLLRENPAKINTCIAENATCRNNLPNAPAANYVWSIPRWQIEAVVAGAAYYQYQNRQDYTRTYYLIVPAATITMGYGNNPPGWSTYETLINLGSPPPDQYLWETISEVGQVALHNYGNTTLPEGMANVAFTLRDVDVGLDADDIRAAMRPKLQEQRHKLSDQLLGDYADNNGAVDFYYRRGADGAPYLFFVAEGDPRPIAAYDYASPGFFGDAALTTKLSSTTAGSSGDSAHEKLSLAQGETTVFMGDDTGAVYRLRFVVGEDPTEIEVFVAKKVR